ncbi:MAG: hypothetical protein N2651_02610 [Fimbriimonadales bacterium]|nr:hypothetical protein [Fimbriimonadales bacterium]
MKPALVILATCWAAALWAQSAPQTIAPLRMMKARLESGRVIPLTSWIETGSFAPAGGCAPGEQNIFDHTADLRSVRPDYHNPYWVNDIRTLIAPAYHGARASAFAHTWFWNPPTGSERCLIIIFTVEQVDAECQVVHEGPFLDAVVLDYGVLGAGVYYSAVCLASLGGLQLPATPADDGEPGTTLLGGYGAYYLRALDPVSGVFTLASRAQPLLGYASVGTSAPLHWSDDNPPSGSHAQDECYRYVDERGRAYGGAIVFKAVPPCAPDIDGNGCVDDADLLTVLFNFGTDGSNGGDANCDGIVDDADLLDVLFNFGSGC